MITHEVSANSYAIKEWIKIYVLLVLDVPYQIKAVYETLVGE